MRNLIIGFFITLILSSSCHRDNGCKFRNWEITARPLTNKGVVKIISHNYFYIELPFKEGDTITRWWDDETYNDLVKKYEELGGDVSDRKFKVLSIKKNCY